MKLYSYNNIDDPTREHYVGFTLIAKNEKHLKEIIADHLECEVKDIQKTLWTKEKDWQTTEYGKVILNDGVKPGMVSVDINSY